MFKRIGIIALSVLALAGAVALGVHLLHKEAQACDWVTVQVISAEFGSLGPDDVKVKIRIGGEWEEWPEMDYYKTAQSFGRYFDDVPANWTAILEDQEGGPDFEVLNPPDNPHQWGQQHVEWWVFP